MRSLRKTASTRRFRSSHEIGTFGRLSMPQAWMFFLRKIRRWQTLLAGEVVHRHRILEQRVVAGDDGDAAIGDEVARAVGFGVIADGGAFGEMDVAVDDAAADAAMASDGDVGEQDTLIDFGIGVHADVGREDGVLNQASGDDAAIGDDGIEGGAHAFFLGEDELGGRVLLLVSADGPVVIVEIEDGGDGDDIHVGFVVGLERAYVAPVESLLLVFIDEVVGEDAVVGDHLGQDVFAEIVGGGLVFGVFQQDGDEDVGIKEIDAHGAGDSLGVPGGTQFGFGGLFLEAVDAAVFVDVNDAEAVTLFGSDLDGGQGDVGGGLEMLLHHLAVVHFVDVIAGEDEDVLGLLGADGINVLVNGVGGTLIPLIADPLHGGKDFDELFYLVAEDVPAFADVAVEGKCFV